MSKVFLADSSIWIAQLRAGVGYLGELFRERLARREVVTCMPVALEVLTGTGDGAAYEQDFAYAWSGLRYVPLNEQASGRAFEVQRRLASTTAGAHRRPAIDYLVAACAEVAGEDVVLWHWDSDLTVICDHTGQPHEPEHERARQHGFVGEGSSERSGQEGGGP